jgi:hypothetical protein
MIPTCMNIDFDKIYPDPDSGQLAAAFFNRLWLKVHVYNFSIIITFYGAHRTGKSLTAVSFSHILDPTFDDNLEMRVCYRSKAILEAFKDIRSQGIHGAAVIIDEAGSGDVSSQRWYEEASKIVSAELQSVGYLNPIIFFVTQDFSFINKTARKLTQGVFGVTRRSNNYSNIKPFWISNDPWSSKIYHKYPVFCYTRSDVPSNIYKINSIKIGLPPSDIKDRYEKFSQAFKDSLLEEGIRSLSKIDDEGKEKKSDIHVIEEAINKILDNPRPFKSTKSKKDDPKLDVAIIQFEFDVSYHKARMIRRIAEIKLKESGYVL